MEDYKEKVVKNEGTKHQKFVDRLSIKNHLWGFRLWDSKISRNILFGRTKDACTQAKELLENGEIESSELQKLVGDEYSITTNVLLEKGKHDNNCYYAIPTLSDLYKVSLYLLKIRMDSGYIQKWDVREPLDYTEDDVEKMPKSLQKKAKDALESNKRIIASDKENNRNFELAEKAIKEENGRLADRIIDGRIGYEYEEIEIITPINID